MKLLIKKMKLVWVIVLMTMALTLQGANNDVSKKHAATAVQIVGDDQTHIADVFFESGVNRLQTSTSVTVTINELLGEDQFASTWCRIDDSTISAGDSIRTQIPDFSIDVTTVAAGGDTPIDLINKHITDLEAVTAYDDNFKARRVVDNAVITHKSIARAEAGEHLDAGDFVCTGSLVNVTEGFDTIQARGKVTSLTADLDDNRVGVLGISGIVNVLPGSISNILIQDFKSAGSSQMAVDGSGVPVIFKVDAPSLAGGFNFNVQRISCYGSDNGIKFGQWLGINSPLSNGFLITIVSEGVTTILPNLQTTDDLKHKLTLGIPTGFALSVQAGRDDIMATAEFSPSFPLIAGSVVDLVKAEVRDDLSSLINFSCTLFGFKSAI